MDLESLGEGAVTTAAQQRGGISETSQILTTGMAEGSGVASAGTPAVGAATAPRKKARRLRPGVSVAMLVDEMIRGGLKVRCLALRCGAQSRVAA